MSFKPVLHMFEKPLEGNMVTSYLPFLLEIPGPFGLGIFLCTESTIFPHWPTSR